MQEGKIGKKNMEMRLCYSAFRQFQFFHQSLESGLQYLQLNTTTALHCIHADNSKASVFSVANYHPRKVGTLCSNMTWWCHGLICIWIKLLNRSRANRSRAQQQALSHFSCWLTLPHSDEASKPLCAVQRHKISSAGGRMADKNYLKGTSNKSKYIWIRSGNESTAKCLKVRCFPMINLKSSYICCLCLFISSITKGHKKGAKFSY